MTEKKTCGDCPWNGGYVCGAGTRRVYCNLMQEMRWIEVYEDETGIDKEHEECPARKAYRILRDEVRRLRGMVDRLEFCGWSHACSGEDCCPCCRMPVEYDAKRGHHVNHTDDCVFTKPDQEG